MFSHLQIDCALYIPSFDQARECLFVKPKNGEIFLLL
uniref:Uncharacterized protein n=1 Tax=Anguilla anguilla TaxID=7936 RepID=A0A0E9Q9L0_ANGAN